MALNLDAYRGHLTVTDGAWGTELQKRGLPAGAPPELWNVENPSAVEDVARQYVQAGSRIILTNTFGSNAFVLARHGWAARAAELAEKGAAISRQAAGTNAKVFASIGPTGKIVMMGEVSQEEIYAAFANVAKAVARGGADAVVVETMTELAEVSLAIRAVREHRPARGGQPDLRQRAGPHHHHDGRHPRAGRAGVGRPGRRGLRGQLRRGAGGLCEGRPASTARPRRRRSGSRPTPACRSCARARRSSRWGRRRSRPSCPPWRRRGPTSSAAVGTTPAHVAAVRKAIEAR